LLPYATIPWYPVQNTRHILYFTGIKALKTYDFQFAQIYASLPIKRTIRITKSFPVGETRKSVARFDNPHLPLFKKGIAVNRHQQQSLVLFLGLISSIPAFAANPSEQGGAWRTASSESASSTLIGKLYRNSADHDGALPYLVLDRWGVVRGYVAAAPGVELESCVGQQVSLQGTVKTLPGGDMPCMTCTRALSGEELKDAGFEHRAAPEPQKSSAAEGRDQGSLEFAPQPDQSPTRDSMAAPPTTRNKILPLHEIVLESPSMKSGDDSQDYRRAPAARRNGSRRNGRSVVQATNYQERIPMPVPTGEAHKTISPQASDPALEPSPMEEGPMISDGQVGGPTTVGCDTSCDDGICGGVCAECCDEPCWGPRRPLFCWGPTGIWVRADYLQWWQRGTQVPPLVTTAPLTTTAPYTGQNAGVIGQAGTEILFGGSEINNKSVSGGRIQAGMWLNACATFGIEAEYFELGEESTNFYLWSDGNPIVSRPFFDTNPNFNREAVERVAFPRGSLNSLDGAIDISATTRFHGSGAHFLITTCRQEGCWTDECDACRTYRDRYRANFTVGYRHLSLDDDLVITETITSTTASADSPNYLNAFLVHDQFTVQNAFNGVDLGMKFEFERNRWSLDVFPRIALGSTQTGVTIDGATRITNAAGQERTVQGGLLAQSTNIGSYSSSYFTVVPELDMNLGFQVTRHARLIVGYDVLYWNKVGRVGEQIDRSVDSNLLVGGNTTATRPQFTLQQTGYWAQGINVGLDLRW
jgi:hypothetical protein